MHSHRRFGAVFALSLVVAQPVYAGKDPLSPSFPIPNYTTSWLGNSYGGPDWVQRYTDDMYVTPDGTCYGATAWDEGGRETGIYKDGKVLGKASDTHGFAMGGGRAVTANSKYLFIGQYVGHAGTADDGGNTWPPKDTIWFGVGRRHLDGSSAPFAGGSGHPVTSDGGAFLKVNVMPQGGHGDITGLAASEKLLFVANDSAAEIDTYDAESMTKVGSFPVTHPRHLAYDASSNALWVIEAPDGVTGTRIVRYSPAGDALGTLTLPEGARATAISVTPSHHLLIGDSGPAQQVLVYDSIDTAPKLLRSFGAVGGIYSAVPGQVAPLKFANPVGVGEDSEGNIYVASLQGGLVLESYAPDNRRNWEVHALEFVEVADSDPASPSNVYTEDHHYVLTPDGQSGRDSTYVGYLVDTLKRPNDPRIQGWGDGSTWMRTIQGRRFLFATNMNAGDIQVYRFTGHGEETALADVINVSAISDKWPPLNHPSTAGYIYRDTNGDGTFDPSKYETSPDNIRTTAWSIDDKGDIRYCFDKVVGNASVGVVREIPLDGIDKIGNPIYSFKSAVDTPVPAPFDIAAVPERMEYVGASDTMYISGFTPEHLNVGRDWKTSGPVICRYDHWSTNPVKRWEIVVPYETVNSPTTQHKTPDAICVAGHRLFNGYLLNGEIRVYDTNDGSYMGSLMPGPEVDHTSGWIDTMYGVRAHQVGDGSYLVFAEEVWHEKVLMYRLQSN